MLEDSYIGCCCPLHQLQALGNEMSEKVIAKINDTQELMMVNDFAMETNEGQFKKSLQDRVADIASWQWVLEDLTKRLEQAVTSLNYEHKAVRVVVQRVKGEVQQHSQEATKPGRLCPKTDKVEVAINEEFHYLKDQRKVFEELLEVVEKQTKSLQNLMNKIKGDILNKNEALAVEEAISKISIKNLSDISTKTAKKKKHCDLTHWENRCLALKRQGLQALNTALLLKQQVRGARVQLTIAAQALANKVDSAIRRRLHTNQAKLAEIEWQQSETEKNLQALEEEQINTEKSILVNMEQERVVLARITDRSYRPDGELTRDEVDTKLKGELARARRFIADLRSNLREITTLQNYLKETIVRMDCYSEDLAQVVKLDKERTKNRLGDTMPEIFCSPSEPVPRSSNVAEILMLNTIQEEDEEDYNHDDYPFEY